MNPDILHSPWFNQIFRLLKTPPSSCNWFVALKGKTVIYYEARKTKAQKYASMSRKGASFFNFTASLTITAAVSLEMRSLTLS